MTNDEMNELRQKAAKCLGKAFTGDSSIPTHIVQAAVSVLSLPDPQWQQAPRLTHDRPSHGAPS